MTKAAPIIAASTCAIELEIAGVAVRVGADAKPRTIEAVLRVLKANS